MPSWKKVIVSGSNAVLNQITASGNFVSDGTVIITGNTGRVGINTLAPDYKLDVAGNAGFNEYLYHNGDSNTYLRYQSDKIDLSAGGNVFQINNRAISGSLTSTGSFGRVEASIIGGNSPLEIESDNFNVSSDGVISGSGISTGSFGHILASNIRTSRLGGKSPLIIESDNFNVDDEGTYSGSASSTGSFGSIHIADRLGIGTTNTFEPVVAYPDQNIIAIFGKAAFKGSSDLMYLSHYDQRSGGGGYAVRQASNGSTNINAASGESLLFSINNDTVARVNEHGLGINATPADDIRLRVQASDNDDGIQLDDQSGNSLFKLFQQSDGVGRMFMKGGGSVVFNLTSGADPSFINIGRNFGIGTSTPVSPLHVVGELRVDGDIIAENYIVSSSVTYMTQSFSSGSTIFGNSDDDIHQFTGSLKIDGANNATNLEVIGLVTGHGHADSNNYFTFQSGTGLRFYDSNGEIKRDSNVMSYYGKSGHKFLIGDVNYGVSIGTNTVTGYGLRVQRSGSSGTAIISDTAGNNPWQFNPSGSNIFSGSSTSTGSFGSLTLADAFQGTLRVASEIRLLATGAVSSPNFSHYASNHTTRLNEFKIMGDNSTILKTSGAYNLRFGTNDVDRLMIQQGTGNVGIGTTSPGAKLTVHGDISGSLTSTGSFGNIQVDGDFLPTTDNNTNLGSPSKRFANIHSADLQLSNEDTKGNDVDGTTGNWTLQEGEEDIFLINNKTGKKYSIMLKEVKQ